jgi:hypothetical protein
MMIVMKPDATEPEVEAVIARVHAGSAVELEPRHVLAIADRADHRDFLAAAEVGPGAHASDPGDDGLHLRFGGVGFHHDHHLVSSLMPGKCTKAGGTGFTPSGGFFGARP